MCGGDYLDIRKMGYRDYYLSQEDIKKVFDYCRNAEGKTEEGYVKCILEGINPGIAESLYSSIVHNKSYTKIYKRNYIPMCEKSFYDWRRKAIYELYSFITLLGG